MLSILALIAITTTSPQISSGLLQAPTVESGSVTVVYLGCQVRQTVLADCQVVNHEPVEPGAAAMALKLAAGMSVPRALADRLGGHIVVKLNVKQ